MVEGVVGLMGEGKTYFTTLRALEALKDGKRVVANYAIHGGTVCNTWDDLLDATIPEIVDGKPKKMDTLCIIDEANLWCPSRFWAKLDPRLLYAWSQSRKFGLDILWTAQHEARVDTALREITYQIWLSRRFRSYFWYRAYIPEQLRKEKRKRLESRLVRYRQDVGDAYDTFQVIDLGTQLLSKERSRAPEYREPESAHWSEPDFTRAHGRIKGKKVELVIGGGSGR